MTQSGQWQLANLSGDGMRLLTEAERTLGTDYLVAYTGAPVGGGQPGAGSLGSLRTARLNQSQVECLQGLEVSLGAVVVAYSRSATAN